MTTVLIFLLILVALGGYGGPAIGYGSYGVAPTGITTVLIVVLLIWIVSA